MIVVDASAIVELLLQTSRAAPIERCLAGHDLFAPDVLDVEVLHALRGLERGGRASGERIDQAVHLFGLAPVQRVPVASLHDEVWVLRHAVSCYDAAYVAVAQILRCGLLTLDRRLAAGAPAGLPVTAL